MSLEESLRNAVSGDREAAKSFLETFLSSTIIVPERKQAHMLSNTPEYPNDFVSMLGVADGERVTVPLFLQESDIKEWCGQELLHKEMKVKNLLEALPEGWWLSLSPQGEIGKEFSPWEVEQLKLGTEAIPDIIEEIFQEEEINPIELKESGLTEYPELKQKLKVYAQERKQIEALYLLKHTSEELLQLAVIMKKREEKIEEELAALVGQALIGQEDFRIAVTTRDKKNDVLSMLLTNMAPFYQTSSKVSLFQKLVLKFTP